MRDTYLVRRLFSDKNELVITTASVEFLERPTLSDINPPFAH